MRPTEFSSLPQDVFSKLQLLSTPAADRLDITKLSSPTDRAGAPPLCNGCYTSHTMLALLFSNPVSFLLVFGGLLMAITLHEFAHCYVTDRLGDPTPRAQDRLTLDPRAHLDPLGTAMILFTGFGWGKPAPYDPYNLQNPTRDAALIAAAGPLTNISIAVILSIVLRLGTGMPEFLMIALAQILVINVSLALFNLLPIYPLDGSRILMSLLPKLAALEYEEFMTRYGTLVLLLMLIPWGGISPLSALLSPLLTTVLSALL